MKARLTVANKNYGVTVADVKDHAHILHDAEDDWLRRQLIPAAYEFIQERSQYALLASKWQERWPGGAFPLKFRLDRPPLIAVAAIKYDNLSLVETTVATTVYRSDTHLRPGIVELDQDQSWPSDCEIGAGRIRIDFWAGHGNTFTASASTDLLTPTDQKYNDGDEISVSAAGGTLPTGLTTGRTYFVRDATATAFKLSKGDGGSAIDITADSSGTVVIDDMPRLYKQAILLIASYWFFNREQFGFRAIDHEIGTRLDDIVSMAGNRVVYA